MLKNLTHHQKKKQNDELPMDSNVGTGLEFFVVIGLVSSRSSEKS